MVPGGPYIIGWFSPNTVLDCTIYLMVEFAGNVRIHRTDKTYKNTHVYNRDKVNYQLKKAPLYTAQDKGVIYIAP